MSRELCLRFAIVVSALVAVCQLVAAQTDMHLTVDPAHAAYQKSSFLHGYIHGYEEGFHVADIDLQMGHRARAVEAIPEFNHPPGKRDVPGAHHARFTSGYFDGFRAGYYDGIQGKDFRAAQELRRLSAGVAGLPEPSLDLHFDAIFDEGIFTGYRAGRSQGLNSIHDNRLSATTAYPCDAAKFDQGKSAVLYCEWLRQGFQLGYGDGYNSAANPQEHARTAKR